MELALATGSWLPRLHHHYGSSFLVLSYRHGRAEFARELD
jgi:hypothetical protein